MIEDDSRHRAFSWKEGHCMRPNRMKIVPVVVALACAAFAAGGGGDAGIAVLVPSPTAGTGAQSSHGTVRMPNGRVAMRPESAMQRFAALVLPEAGAVSGNASAVGGGVEVRLSHLLGNGQVDSPNLAHTLTNS